MKSLINEPSLSPTKQTKNSRRKTYHLQHHPHQYQHHHQHQAARLPRQSSSGAIPHQYAPPRPPHVQMEMVHALTGGVFLNHFPNQFSLSSSFPPILPTHHQQKMNNNQQPPLLPLPVVSKPSFRSLPPPPITRNHSLPYPLPKKQPNKTKLNPTTTTTNKQTTTPQKNAKKEAIVKSKATTIKKNGSSLVENDQPSVGPNKITKGVKPDPKETSRVLQPANHKNEIIEEKQKHVITTLASVFSISPESPPPSSLPLPKFPLMKLQQTKLSCTAEAAAAEVDTGATKNLCRMLKLR